MAPKKQKTQKKPNKRVRRLTIPGPRGTPLAPGRVSRGILARSATNISDLSQEEIQHIFGFVNIRYHDNLRSTNQQFHFISDQYLLHGFQCARHRQMKLNPKSRHAAALTVMNLATEVYRLAGFSSTFCSTLLPMIRQAYEEPDPFLPPTNGVLSFNTEFYNKCDRIIGNTHSQRAILLFTMTLFRLFKKFDGVTIKTSSFGVGLPQMQFIIEIHGPWLATLWTDRACRKDPSLKRNNLLAMVAHMLVHSLSAESFKRVWECPMEVYVFGHDSSSIVTRRSPKIIFNCLVQGSERVCEHLKLCLQNDRDKDDERVFEDSNWPNDQFRLIMETTCKAAAQWGCPVKERLDIGLYGCISKRKTRVSNEQYKTNCETDKDESN